MTKQEQIENMVDVMAASNDPFVDVPLEIMPQVAEALYNTGYRKVLLNTEDGKMVDCVQYAPWQLIKGYTEREVKKARKETAEKILKEIRGYYPIDKEHCDKSESFVLELCDTLAKEYDVEIEK